MLLLCVCIESSLTARRAPQRSGGLYYRVVSALFRDDCLAIARRFAMRRRSASCSAASASKTCFAALMRPSRQVISRSASTGMTVLDVVRFMMLQAYSISRHESVAKVGNAEMWSNAIVNSDCEQRECPARKYGVSKRVLIIQRL